MFLKWFVKVASVVIFSGDVWMQICIWEVFVNERHLELL